MVHHSSGEIGLDHDYTTTTLLKSSSSNNNENSSIVTVPTAQTLIKEIINIYQQLKNARNLQPSEHINSLFTKLVHICILPIDQSVLNQVLNDHSILDILYSLRELCSQGEYHLESHWSNYFISSLPSPSSSSITMQKGDNDHQSWVNTTKEQLSKFVYYQNYVDLTKIECHALLGVGASLKHVIFIGSGPLPLSSLEMLLQHPTLIERIDNVDIDHEAIRLSSMLTKQLAIPKEIQSRLHYYQSDATLYQGYEKADVICLGALVGNDQNKFDILSMIAQKMRPGSWLLLRSAHGLRQLLYSSLSPTELNTSPTLSGLLEVVLELHPHHDVVNSVLIARRI
ncbi:Nicotianamine synthase protein-domain-containing protein [Cunninghamella echinulata]|nr:Nicotianamine synthase protein-domain-containing protein [Cunninghamella echinulata]